MTSLDALMTPPKSIWNPDEDEDHDIVDGAHSGSPTETTSAKSQIKHPSELSEIELRVQLYDSYRLARIILGAPIKSFSLRSKTILHSIRIVAEMKLELIRLQKELELSHLRTQNNRSFGAAVISKDAATTTSSSSSAAFIDIGRESDRLEEEEEVEDNDCSEVRKKHEEHVESTRSQLESIAERLQSTPSTFIDEQTQTEDVGALARSERSEILDMVQKLMAKVEVTSEKLNDKFIELNKKMQSKQRDSANDMETLEKTLKTRQTIHSIELESNRAKHLQQVMDMTGQIESYKEQVERQQESLMELTAKYENLESIAVTSDEALEVLKAIESIDGENEGHEDPSTLEAVQIRVVELLKRMSTMSSRNQSEKQNLDDVLRSAQEKERESEDELAYLTLQKEMLKEETQTPLEELANSMAITRSTHKKELTEILKREEKRLQQMEFLEVYLTELAFKAVEIEDLMKYSTESKAACKIEISALKSKQVETHKTLKSLKTQISTLMKDQKQTLKELDQRLYCLDQKEEKPNSNLEKTERQSFDQREKLKTDSEFQELTNQVASISRIRQLEQALAKRDEELANARNNLHQCQRRVEELETMGGAHHEAKYPGGVGDSSVCTSPLSSRSSS